MKTLVSLCTFGLPMPEEGWARLDAAWRSSRLNILSQKSESAFGEVQVRHETETARKQASQLCRVAGTSPGWRTRFACIHCKTGSQRAGGFPSALASVPAAFRPAEPLVPGSHWINGTSQRTATRRTMAPSPTFDQATFICNGTIYYVGFVH